MLAFSGDQRLRLLAQNILEDNNISSLDFNIYNHLLTTKNFSDINPVMDILIKDKDEEIENKISQAFNMIGLKKINSKDEGSLFDDSFVDVQNIDVQTKENWPYSKDNYAHVVVPAQYGINVLEKFKSYLGRHAENKKRVIKNIPFGFYFLDYGHNVAYFKRKDGSLELLSNSTDSTQEKSNELALKGIKKITPNFLISILGEEGKKKFNNSLGEVIEQHYRSKGIAYIGGGFIHG